MTPPEPYLLPKRKAILMGDLIPRQLRPRRSNSNDPRRDIGYAPIRAIDRMRHRRADGPVRAAGADSRSSFVSELGGEDGGTEDVDQRGAGGWERVGVREGSELVC